MKEVESRSCGSTYRNRMGGGASQGEGANLREALTQRGVAYIRRPCSEGHVSYLGRSRLCLKG